MKKYLVLLLAAALLACSACGKKQVVQSGTLGEEELVTASTAELVYKNESYTLRFNKNEAGDWQWKDDTTLPLDQQQMQQLLDQVSALNTLTPLETTGDSTAYDLDAPDRTLEIKNSDGTGLSLQIGAAVEGGGYYMSRAIDQAFWNVTSNGKRPKDMLFKWSEIANREIARKMREYPAGDR